MDNKLVKTFFKQINDLINYKLGNLTKISSATIHSANNDQTYNIIFPSSSTIYHNVQNQSIYNNLLPGDHVKVLIENGSLSSMWIIGGCKLEARRQTVLSPSNINDATFDKIYPIGSIYLSINHTSPSILFGGVWKQIGHTSVQDETVLSSSIYIWTRLE